MANAKTFITDEQIVAVIHDKEKSRKDREREAVDMVRQQMAEAKSLDRIRTLVARSRWDALTPAQQARAEAKSLARERAIEDRIRRRMRD